MSEYSVVYNKWYNLGVFNSLEKAEEFAERMKTDREIFEYHCQHDISGNVSDLIEICDTTGQDC
mgnify:FL=1|jgi:hypothetical protein|tara:strand:+ start:204 stop:395 length:192 start_codon:yes stop_codon:yes gene_type:complete